MTTSVVNRPKDAEVMRPERTTPGRCFQPNVDIRETADELTVFVDMPGVTSQGVDINFENGTLSIHGKVQRRCPDNAVPLLREYGVGDYHRTFQVSEKIDSARIAAELAQGVLTLHLPKAESIKPRKITLQGR